jgi:hypothetical protein
MKKLNVWCALRTITKDYEGCEGLPTGLFKTYGWAKSPCKAVLRSS